jgi:hypothetical protein
VRTEDLIATLSARIEPVSRFAVERRVGLAIMLGMLTALLQLWLWLWLGVRPDIVSAAHTAGFWLKLAFPLAIGVLAMALSCRLGRPACPSGQHLRLLGLPVVIILIIASLQNAGAPTQARLPMWLGETWLVCPGRILFLSIPALAAMMWAFGRLAPTRLRLAGLSAGLTAGAATAAVYALGCQEDSLAFVATWYSLGMLLVGVVGAAIGPEFLRW